MARAFASDLKYAPGAILTAVTSRNFQHATAFAAEYTSCRAMSSCEELAGSDLVDVVYVASPHSLHHYHALLALRSGKPVLCEKPFTINLLQAKAVAALARDRKLFLMEAMWTRFIPAVVKLRELLAQEVIGDVTMMMAGGAFIPEFDPEFYLFNPQLGGGVLLDAGVYLVSLASMIFGAPSEVFSVGEIGATGVDEHEAMLLRHDSGAIASLYVSLRARSSPDVVLLGNRGRIYVHPPLFGPRRLTVSVQGRPDEEIEMSFDGGGYQFQVMEVMRCLEQGFTESAVMPIDETLRIMSTLDRIRADLGVVYPFEK